MSAAAKFEEVGNAFVQHYYNTFDQSRQNLAPLYQEDSLMSWEGDKIQGRAKILEKLGSLPFQTVKHVPSTIDCQPSISGGVLISVTGTLQVDQERPLQYTQVFHLMSNNGNFFLTNDIFRFNFGG